MDTQETPADLIGLAEAAKLLPCIRPGRKTNVATIWRKVDRGELRAWRMGRWLLVSRADVIGLIREFVPRTRESSAAKRHRDAMRKLKQLGIG